MAFSRGNPVNRLHLQTRGMDRHNSWFEKAFQRSQGLRDSARQLHDKARALRREANQLRDEGKLQLDRARQLDQRRFTIRETIK